MGLGVQGRYPTLSPYESGSSGEVDPVPTRGERRLVVCKAEVLVTPKRGLSTRVLGQQHCNLHRAGLLSPRNRAPTQ